MSEALAYYAAIGAALFPIPYGQKNPTGLISSFARDCSTDPAVWARWEAAHPRCNWGIVAGASGLVIVDIDAKEGRDAAWAAWCELCRSWGVEPIAPHVQSARGGWHVLFHVPEGVDARALRQPDAIKGLINIRAGNGYVVAAGSYYDGTPRGEASGPYVLLAERPPDPAPTALIEHCRRKLTHARTESGQIRVGSWDPGDIAVMLDWLNEKGRDAFAAYEDWLSIGMALKVEFGDAGRDLWARTFDGTVSSEVEATKWASFASEPRPDLVTLRTWFDKAHKMGWTGRVRHVDMFGNAVAAMAASAGAQLTSAPLVGAHEELQRRGIERAREFLAATCEEPSLPHTSDFPRLPESKAGEPFYAALQDCIGRIIAIAEGTKKPRISRALPVLAYLAHVDREICNAVVRRCSALGASISELRVGREYSALQLEIKRHFIELGAVDFHRDVKGIPEANNSDNVKIFLNMIGAEVRFNAWTERIEIRGAFSEGWAHLSDSLISRLRSRGNRTEMRFVPSKEFLWDGLEAIAHEPENEIDPALDLIKAAQSNWDGVPRLAIWLSAVCGVPADRYHQAVGRNIIGGLVRRIRQPGCKHDTMAVFCGPQGTGKSTMAAILAMDPTWFTDATHLDEDSKELVLLLAGKCIAEISEMTSRKKDIDKVKAQISKQIDMGRPAYGRTVVDRPRRNIFIGTTNSLTPLTDDENRRFLPVMTAYELNLDWLLRNLAQLIGEAAHLESRGETFAMPREAWEDARAYQEAARVESDTEILMDDWLAITEFGGQWQYITAKDLADLLALAGWRGNNSQRGENMRRLGFRLDIAWIDGKRMKIWARGPAALPHHIIEKGTRYLVNKDHIGRVFTQLKMIEKH